jgi:hypothetical protein
MDQIITEQERSEYFAFLDDLRDSGLTNMYGAVSYLMKEFPLLRFDEALARRVLLDWIKSYTKEPD